MIYIFISLGVVALICLIILFLIFPGRRGVPFGEKMRFAHRGLFGGEIPENSLAAFRRAVEKGVGVEFDVHLTQDDKLIVFHDDDLKRMCGVDKITDKCTYDELEALSLNGTEEKIPSFEEVLETIGGKVPILLEIKQSKAGRNAETCRAVAEVLKRYNGKYVIESFNPMILNTMRKLLPDVSYGQLSGGIKNASHGVGGAILGFLLSNLLFNFISRPDFIAYNINNDKNVMFRLVRALGAPCFMWTIRDDWAHLQAENYDGEIFETYK